MVKADGKMFSAWTGSMGGSEVEATHVVLECAAFDAGCGTMNRKALFIEVFKQVNNCNNLTEGRGQGNVLSFGCAEGCDALDFRFPENRAASI